MTAHRHTARAGFWSRTTRALGKLWQGVINLPDRPDHNDRRNNLFDIPRFPPF